MLLELGLGRSLHILYSMITILHRPECLAEDVDAYSAASTVTTNPPLKSTID